LHGLCGKKSRFLKNIGIISWRLTNIYLLLQPKNKKLSQINKVAKKQEGHDVRPVSLGHEQYQQQ